MAIPYLEQQISQFCTTDNFATYIRPLTQNLTSGIYISEITDVKAVTDINGNLDAFDFYHKLVDSSGNVFYVRFRFYKKELPALSTSLKQYPKVKIWKDTIGLQEHVTIAPKQTGDYMHISERKICSVNITSASSNASVTNAQPSKRGGLSSRLGNRCNKSVKTASKTLIFEDTEDVDDDFDDDFDDFLDDTED